MRSENVRRWLVWIFRLVLGGTYIVSGLSKMLDLWGFVYKIEQYLSVWGLSEPRTLVLGGAMSLSAGEFIVGLALFTGSYKRTSAWLITLLTGFMLILTAYIVVADPVDNCGCFGDFIILSNTATFLKNLVLMAMAVYLWRNNATVAGIFSPYSQWIEGLIAFLYVAVVGTLSYNIQPMIDFRPYPVGTVLAGGEEKTDDGDIRFIYERDGVKETFDADNLPDSTWTFVDREEPAGTGAADKRTFTIYDGDEDVTDFVLEPEGDQLLVLVPEPARADISSTYLLNELNRYMTQHGGVMTAVIGTDGDGIEEWRDMSLASYDIYSAEDTSIKEVARGNVAIVLLHDGVIRWKRTLVSVDSDMLASPDDTLLDRLDYAGSRYFWLLSIVFIGLEFLLWVIDRSGRLIKNTLTHKSRKK